MNRYPPGAGDLEVIQHLAKAPHCATPQPGRCPWCYGQGLANTPLVVDEGLPVPPPITEPITVDLPIVAVTDSPEHAVSLAGNGVAADPAVHADGRRGLQVPFARVVVLEGLVGEYAGGARLHEVAAEGTLKDTITMPAEINMVVPAQHVEVSPLGGVAVETNAAVTLDAAVHLAVDERGQY